LVGRLCKKGRENENGREGGESAIDMMARGKPRKVRPDPGEGGKERFPQDVTNAPAFQRNLCLKKGKVLRRACAGIE